MPICEKECKRDKVRQQEQGSVPSFFQLLRSHDPSSSGLFVGAEKWALNVSNDGFNYEIRLKLPIIIIKLVSHRHVLASLFVRATTMVVYDGQSRIPLF